MHTIQDKQFRLNENGQVLFQRDPTNPLPGEPVARLHKGAGLYAPSVVLDDIEIPVALTDRATAQARLDEWIVSHMNTVIGPLVALGTADAPEIDTPVAQICRRVHESLGILPRADIDNLIEALDADTRRELRSRRVRLGPVLVSMPDLTKPAAVRLRALLWALWNDKALPVSLPPDGMVSVVVDAATIDPHFYRSIGYPVYASRAIRVDMLDRVISAIYDSADKGVFKARHDMAEWLGCPIAELYDILTAMGHTKISDPADTPKTEITPAPEGEAEETAAAAAVSVDVAEAVAEPFAEAPVEASAEAADITAPDTAITDDTGPTEVPVPVPQVKPELATFRLRRGRAHHDASARAPRERNFRRSDRQKGEGEGNDGAKRQNRSERKPHDGKGGGRGDHRSDHKNEGKPGGKFRDNKFRDNKRHDDRPRDNREDRIVASANAQKNDDNSPFAVLNQLKLGRKE